MGVFSIGAFNFAFVLVRASDLGVSDSMVLLTYALTNGFHTLIGYPAGVLAERIGKETVLLFSYCVFLNAHVHKFGSCILLYRSLRRLHRIAETVQRGGSTKVYSE
jgi:hypothetical protein